MLLNNKNIIVTGANRGIGRAISELCAINGANLWVCMRSVESDVEETWRETAEINNVSITPISLDLSDEDSIKDAVSKILKEKKIIHGIVNNAGVVGENSMFAMTSFNDIRSTFDVNFFGPMMFTQRLIKNMIKNKTGSIVNISSVAALDGRPSSFSYISSKSALIGASTKLANELGSYNIRVNAVAPGVTKTDMLDFWTESALDKAMSNSIIKRPAESKEIANAVVFLLSDMSSYITGQVIRVDGGGN